MLKAGKKTKHWHKVREQLKKLYFKKGITYCEIDHSGCWKTNALGFAHRHKRRWYNTRPELLGSFNQTLLACNSCHQKIEYDQQLTEQIFARLRGKEEIGP